MREQSWLLDQIKELENLANKMGQEGVVLGLKHALAVCAEESNKKIENEQTDQALFILNSLKKNGHLTN